MGNLITKNSVENEQKKTAMTDVGLRTKQNNKK